MANARITGWRAYFANGQILTSKTIQRWTDIPDDGLLGLVIFFSDGKKRRLTGGDYFYLNTTQDKYGADSGLLQDLALKYPGSFLVRGYWTDDENMRRIEASMKGDSQP